MVKIATSSPSIQGTQVNHAKNSLTAKEICYAVKIIGYARVNARGPSLDKTVRENTSAGYQWNADQVFVITRTKKCLN